MRSMHPYQEYIDQLEKKHNKSVEELIRDFYIDRDEGPSVTARELGIPRKVVLHFIHEHNLRPIKHRNLNKNSHMEP